MSTVPQETLQPLRDVQPVANGPACTGPRQRPEVQLDHARVAQQLAAGAGVGVTALVEDVAAVADLEAATGVLLDHQDGHTGVVDHLAAQEHLVLEHRGEPGRRLVEQQQRRVEHQRPAHRHHLSLAAGQRSGALVGPFGEPREQPGDDLVALVESLGVRKQPISRFSRTVSAWNTFFVCGTKPTPRWTSLWAG